MKGWLIPQSKMLYTTTGTLIEGFDITACINNTSNCAKFPTILGSNYTRCVGDHTSLFGVTRQTTNDTEKNKKKGSLFGIEKSQAQQQLGLFLNYNTDTMVYELPKDLETDLNNMDFYCIKTNDISRASIARSDNRPNKYLYDNEAYYCPNDKYGYGGYCFSSTYVNPDHLSNCLLNDSFFSRDTTSTYIDINTSCTHRDFLSNQQVYKEQLNSIQKNMDIYGWPEPYKEKVLAAYKAFSDSSDNLYKRVGPSYYNHPDLVKARDEFNKFRNDITNDPAFQEVWTPMYQKLLVERSNLYNEYPNVTIATSNASMYRPQKYIHPRNMEIKNNPFNDLFCPREDDILHDKYCIPNKMVSTMTNPFNNTLCTQIYNGTCKLNATL